MNQKSVIVAGIVLYLLSTGVSYAAFNFLNQSGEMKSPAGGNPTPIANGSQLLNVDPSEPKTEACPLNGQLYTKTEKAAWDKRRPLVVMVENSADARPHSGIIRADLVYEAVAEGGVTRFMPIYYCDAQISNVVVAPVRSVRTYFIDWASEYGKTPLFAHVGGANCSAEKIGTGYGPCKTDKRAQAIEQLSDYGWRYAKGNDLDQFSVGAKAYIRNENRLGKPVATEHSVEGRTEKLWQVGAERGWTNLDPEGNEWSKDFTPWKFKDDAPESGRGQVKQIAYDFWEGYKQYDARWEYDATANLYKRFTGGEPHLDLETKQQLNARTVIVLLAKEIGPVDDLKHMLYQTSGEGKAYIFQDGNVIEANWAKKNRLARTKFTTKKGDEIQFNRGRIWISVVDLSTNVAY